MAKKVTISDIAKMAGVSKSTVSRYLNNGYISEKKSAIISQLIRDTGFKSNFFASRLKTKYSRLIGIVLPRIDSYAVGQMLAGITQILNEQSYQAIIITSDLDHEKEIRAIHQFNEQGVDAIIVISIGITEKQIEIVHQYSTPIVFAGQYDKRLSCIKFNDKKAGSILGEYLRQKGFKTCVYLGVPDSDKAVGIERRNGFIKAFKNKVILIHTDFSFEQAYAQGDKIMSYTPSVVVGATDNIALGFLKYLHQNKINVPQKIALAGFGGYSMGEVSSPSLTSIFFNFKALGRKIAFFTFKRLSGETFSSYFEDDFKLLIREST
ncbi:LacI family DNA-binding transcriptional regulator [Pectinatus sottacetonis]|uniref:LacI family DNA-binding transcriptional regulator n=1 Tax=Pectinatus sottacetonis TaxID=1002795 RepID=UPI0018C85632|nr:LacI family DNA-binding transcriptional regulator [Pectinatus sottacetonis]